jgi:two-component system, OmpR family, response regulator
MNDMDFVMTRTVSQGAPTHAGRRPLRVLVADDDPASRRFLGDGLRLLGADPHECADGAAAIERARREAFDLLLLDCRMPGAGARQILTALRNDTGARSTHSPAVATSAELSPADHAELLAAGFSDVLRKPCDIAALQRLLLLTRDPAGTEALLDDSAALVSVGDVGTMLALRGLLREELASLHGELDRHGAGMAALGERLHRLRSSCGFCGAAALGAEVILLQRQLALGDTALAATLPRFRRTLLATLEALDRPTADA